MAIAMYRRRTCACKSPNDISGGNNTSDTVAMIVRDTSWTCIGALGARRS